MPGSSRSSAPGATERLARTGTWTILWRRTFGDGGAGKIRSFPIGLLLTIITLGIYYFFWYYLLNDELKDIGVAKADRKLAEWPPSAWWTVSSRLLNNGRNLS